MIENIHKISLDVTFVHPFFSIVESYLTIYIWWNSFQYHYATIDYHHHLVSMIIAYRQGHSSFLVEMFGAERRNDRGHLYFGKTHPKHVFWGGYRDPIKVRTFFMFFLDLFIMFNRGGVTSIVTCTPCVTAKRVKRVLLPGNEIPNREWTQAWKRTTAMSRLLVHRPLLLYSLTKHHVHARFCIVNSAPAQSVRVYNDLMGQRTNTAKLNWLLYNVEDIISYPLFVHAIRKDTYGWVLYHMKP